MSFHRSRRVVLRLGIPLVAISMAVMAVGSVTAESGDPNTIHVTQSGALTVDASGTWSWGEMATATKMSYAGFAIDWGDVASGNTVGSYHVGDGTPATNVVMQPTSPDQGSSGSWGAVSHTYAKAGTYNVCVIMYDLGEVKPFKTTGYHSLQAGGVNRNTDNSVDNNNQVPAMCATIDVTDPTPSPFESFQGATSNPTATPFQSLQGATSQPTSTPPPTSTTSVPSAPNQGVPMLLLVLLFGSMLASVAVVKTVKVRR